MYGVQLFFEKDSAAEGYAFPGHGLPQQSSWKPIALAQNQKISRGADIPCR